MAAFSCSLIVRDTLAATRVALMIDMELLLNLAGISQVQQVVTRPKLRLTPRLAPTTGRCRFDAIECGRLAPFTLVMLRHGRHPHCSTLTRMASASARTYRAAITILLGEYGSVSSTSAVMSLTALASSSACTLLREPSLIRLIGGRVGCF